MTVTFKKGKKPAVGAGTNAIGGDATSQLFVGLVTAAKAALAYISNGLAVLPLPSMSKKPNMNDWPDFPTSRAY